MDTTTSISTAPPVAPSRTRTLGALAAAGALAAGALANFGNLTSQSGEDGGARAFVICAAVALALTAILFARVVPRAGGSPRTALVLACLAVLSLAAFWAGLPIVFGLAAIAVAVGRERSTPASVALVIAGLATAAGVAGALFG